MQERMKNWMAQLKKQDHSVKVLLGFTAVLTMLFFVVAACAFYIIRHEGWKQDMSVSGLMFYMNEKRVGEEVARQDVMLARGEEAELDLNLATKGNATGDVMVQYYLKFSASSASQDPNLMEAIEVYRLEGQDYVFVDMLSDFLADTKQLPAQSNYDEETYQVTGFLGMEDTDLLQYRFVYSQGAGNRYENLQCEISVEAYYDIVHNTNSYFISDERDLKDLADDAGMITQLAGKTLVLLSDVELKSDYTFIGKLGIDLNGHTLSGKDGVSKLTIIDPKAGDPTAEDWNLKIADTGAGEEGKLDATIQIVLDMPNDILLIDDAFRDSARIVLKDNAFGLSALAAHMDEEMQALDTVYTSTDYVDFTKDLKYYLYLQNGGTNLVNMEVWQKALSSALDNHENDVAHAFTYQFAGTEILDTDLLPYKVMLQSGMNTETLYGDIAYRGSDTHAIAEYYLNALPDVIHASQFFTEYDSKTKARLTWVVEDSRLMDQEGRFLPKGLEVLDHYMDRTMRVGIVAELNGERSYAEREITFCVLTPEERTELIYKYISMSLTMTDETICLLPKLESSQDGEYRYMDTYLMTDLFEKCGFISYTLDMDTDTQTIANPNYAGLGEDGTPQFYIVTEQSETIFNGSRTEQYRLALKPNSATAIAVPTSISFTYQDHPSDPVVITNYVTAIGQIASYSAVDLTTELQQYFSSNAYLNADRYTFYVNGTASDGTKIDYFLTEAADSAFISVENDIYLHVNPAEYETSAEYKTAGSATYYIYDGSTFTPVGNDAADYDEVYVRTSKVTILPAFVPKEGKEATLQAKVVSAESMTYEPVSVKDAPVGTIDACKGSGTKEYLKEQNSSSEVVYTLSMDIEGLYHNTPEEIADYALYQKLLQYFDLDGDGWISVSEARTEQDELTAALGNDGSDTYLKLNDAKIENLKGIEYFTGVTGLNLAGNAIVDLAPLSDLKRLSYLNLEKNLITAIDSLAYLDSLTHLDLSENDITDITAIQYLENIKWLDLSLNENLKSIEAIQEYEKLTYLDVYLQAAALKNESAKYILSYLANNNASLKIYSQNEAGTNRVADTFTADEKAAAAVLALLQPVTETFNTFVLTTEYEGYVFKYVSASTGDIAFYDADGSLQNATDAGWKETDHYQITSPLTDKNIPIMIYAAKKNANGELVRVALCRNIEVNLLQLKNESSKVYIECTDGIVRVAQEVVPDPVLLQKLFQDFNTVKDGVVYIGADNQLSGAGTELANDRILTQEEIKASLRTLEYANAGITCLDGISQFAGGIDELNLAGNSIILLADGYPDIRELSELSKLTTLTLGGQKYDFSQLNTYTETENANGSYTGKAGTGLTSLKTFHVEQCYALDDDEVLKGLYQVYLTNKSCSIYKDSASEVWNPYLIPMEKYMNALPSELHFMDLGETKSIYVDETGMLYCNVRKSGNTYYYQFFFYEVKHIDFTARAGTVTGSADAKAAVSFSNGSITYNQYVTFSDSAYMPLTLAGNDGRANVTGTRRIHLNLEFNHNLMIQVGDMTEPRPVEEVFPGYDLRKAVLKLYAKGQTLLQSSSLLSVATNGQFTIDGIYYSRSGKVMDGLQYTNVTDLFVRRDISIGDGSALVNLTTLRMGYAAADFSELNRELPKLKNIYCATTGFSGNSGFMTYLKLYDKSQQEALNPYLEKLAGVSLSTYSMTAADWNELRALVRKKDGNGKYYFYLNYLPNLQNLQFMYCVNDDWRGMVSFLFKQDEPNGGADANSLASLTMYRNDGTYKQQNTNGRYSEPIIRQIYLNSTAGTKKYQIGTANNAAATTMYNPATYWKQPNNSNTGSYTAAISASEQYKNYAALLKDLFVKLDGTAYSDLAKHQITTAGTITLPDRTGDVSYGTNSTTDLDYTRNYKITWKVLGSSGISIPAGTDGVITLTGLTPGYYCLVGTINGVYYDASGAEKTISGAAAYQYLYPVLVTGNTGNVYEQLQDEALRFAVFSACNASGNAGAVLTETAAASITALTYAKPAGYVIYPDGVTTLSGLSALSGLKTLAVENQYLTNLTGIPASVQSLKVSGNLITDASALSGLTGLRTLELQNNQLLSLSGIPTGVASLNLANDQVISGSDLKSFAEKGAKLTELNVSGTRAAASLQMVEALLAITEQTGASISYTSTTGSASVLSHAVVDAFYAYLTNGTGDSVFETFLNGNLQHTNLTSFTAGLLHQVTWLDNGKFDRCGTVERTARVTHKDYAQLRADIRREYYVTSNVKKNLLIQYADAANNQTITYDSLDPAMYLYLASLGSSTTTDTITVPASKLVDIAITSDYAITSLKGLDQINAIKTLAIANNPIAEIGFTRNSRLESLTISDCGMKAEGLFGLRYATALTKLDLKGVSGICYEDVTALTGLSALKKLYINNISGYGNLLMTQSMSAAAYLQSASVLGIPVSQLTEGLFMTGVIAYDGTVTHTYEKRNPYIAAYLNEQYWNDANLNKNLKKEDGTGVTYNQFSSGFQTISELFSQLLTGMPDKIYYDDFITGDSKGLDEIVIYLPDRCSFMDKTYTVSYQISYANKDVTAETLSAGKTGQHKLTLSDALLPALKSAVNGDKVLVTYTLQNGAKTVTGTKELVVVRESTNESFPEEITETLVLNAYVENEYGHIVPASYYFESGRLVDFFFNKVKSGSYVTMSSGAYSLYKLTSDRPEYADYGAVTYLPYDVICRVKTLKIANVDSSAGTISLKGMELFVNTKELTVMEGYPMDFSYLKNMKLEKFKFTSAANIVVRDWSFLYNSTDTLTAFEYATSGNVGTNLEMEDLGFLMRFPNLTSVIIGTNAGNQDLASFKYVLSWMQENRSLTSFMVKGTEYCNSSILTTDINKAQYILSQLTCEDDSSFILQHNYELLPKTDSMSGLTLPAYIDYGGLKYPIEWISTSNYIAITKTQEQKEEAYFDGLYTWKLSYAEPSDAQPKLAYVVCRINVDGCYYERKLCINLSERREYPAVLMEDGCGTVVLPGLSWHLSEQDTVSRPSSGILKTENAAYILIYDADNSVTKLILKQAVSGKSDALIYDGTNAYTVYASWSAEDMQAVTDYINRVVQEYEDISLTDGAFASLQDYQQAQNILAGWQSEFEQLSYGRQLYYYSQTVNGSIAAETKLQQVKECVKTFLDDVQNVKDEAYAMVNEYDAFYRVFFASAAEIDFDALKAQAYEQIEENVYASQDVSAVLEIYFAALAAYDQTYTIQYKGEDVAVVTETFNPVHFKEASLQYGKWNQGAYVIQYYPKRTDGTTLGLQWSADEVMVSRLTLAQFRTTELQLVGVWKETATLTIQYNYLDGTSVTETEEVSSAQGIYVLNQSVKDAESDGWSTDYFHAVVTEVAYNLAESDVIRVYEHITAYYVVIIPNGQEGLSNQDYIDALQGCSNLERYRLKNLNTWKFDNAFGYTDQASWNALTSGRLDKETTHFAGIMNSYLGTSAAAAAAADSQVLMLPYLNVPTGSSYAIVDTNGKVYGKAVLGSGESALAGYSANDNLQNFIAYDFFFDTKSEKWAYTYYVRRIGEQVLGGMLYDYNKHLYTSYNTEASTTKYNLCQLGSVQDGAPITVNYHQANGKGSAGSATIDTSYPIVAFDPMMQLDTLISNQGLKQKWANKCYDIIQSTKTQIIKFEP